ncbi:regulatory protein RecX [Frankia sp. CNm7]|uniref:Regulatory protein RecX n=1 Tax=Frankia nepalensis TaxID=1836974 RepID=A0A937RDU2_9ACTN|nr:regulatory protein RecX [Frankia nepalensis]MBL7501330.1 regulatory protein RecX [Frankia nepalensis]MBL7510820.1 regulatory protein RecX [Frankia nepalensis]MBL7519706.1 regulatory protein RecX [Frankia nepalensis]MBL7628595.1 regulatory protein RecX [Frankia nepalensis]
MVGSGSAGRGAVDAGRDPVGVAREICLRQLTVRARSRAELAATLRRRGVADDVAQETLDRLTAVGLIDDDAFAAAVISSGRENKGLARQGLAAELRRRGVDDEVAASALAGLSGDEEATARALAARRLRTMDGLERRVQLRRLVAMLGRKGYSTDLAVRVVTDLLGPGGDEAGDEAEADLADDI